jgi:subtilisin family serine protease
VGTPEVHAGSAGVVSPRTTANARALGLVGLVPLMSRSSGATDVTIALIDGPVAIGHPGLAADSVHDLASAVGSCERSGSIACQHGTFVAGMLSGTRQGVAPAICPGCTLVVRPIFAERGDDGGAPTAHADTLAEAIVDVVRAGASIINLSAAFERSSGGAERKLRAALDYAGRKGVVTVAAAGNGGGIGASVITSHPWAIPVAACDLQGTLAPDSNLGASLGRRGVLAPGDSLTSLSSDGASSVVAGSSVAAPFVTGTLALLLSEFPAATPAQAKLAVTQVGPRRSTIVPPVLDAWAAFRLMATVFSRSRNQ